MILLFGLANVVVVVSVSFCRWLRIVGVVGDCLLLVVDALVESLRMSVLLLPCQMLCVVGASCC